MVPKVESEPSLCPVAAFDRYTAACFDAGINLRDGYLFPPTFSPLHNTVRNAPFSSSAATKRLRLYLPDEDITAHGSRAGAAITLLMLGASKEAVMEHCRWATDEVFRHYTKLNVFVDLTHLLVCCSLVSVLRAACLNATLPRICTNF